MRDKVSQNQIMALTFLCTLSPAIRILPKSAVEPAGRAAWLSPVVAAMPVLIYILIIYRFMKNRADGEGLMHQLEKSIGRTLGRIVTALIGVWLIVYCGIELRIAGERLVSSIYSSGSLVMFMAVLLIVSAIIACGKFKSIAGTASALIPAVAAVLVFIVLFSAPDIDRDNLFPVWRGEIKGVLLGAVPVIDVCSIIIYFAFLGGYSRKQEESLAPMLRWHSFALLAILCLMITTVGSISAELIVRLQNSFLVMVRNIRVFTIVERVEAALLTVWFITDFALMASMLCISAENIASSIGKKRSPWLVAVCAVFAGVIAYGISGNAFDLEFVSETVVPAVHMSIAFGLLPLCLGIGIARKKI